MISFLFYIFVFIQNKNKFKIDFRADDLSIAASLRVLVLVRVDSPITNENSAQSPNLSLANYFQRHYFLCNLILVKMRIHDGLCTKSLNVSIVASYVPIVANSLPIVANLAEYFDRFDLGKSLDSTCFLKFTSHCCKFRRIFRLIMLIYCA